MPFQNPSVKELKAPKDKQTDRIIPLQILRFAIASPAKYYNTYVISIIFTITSLSTFLALNVSPRSFSAINVKMEEQ